MRITWSGFLGVPAFALVLGAWGFACAKGEEAEDPGASSTSSSSGGRTDGGDDDEDVSASLPPKGDSGNSTSSSSGGTGDEDGGDEETDAGKDSGPVGNACATALAALSYDFTADQGWTHRNSDGVTGSWPFDPWGRGTAGNGLSCASGACWASELNQNYAQCQRGELVSPAINLSACTGQTVALVFTHAYKFKTFTYNGSTWSDGGIIEVSGNNSTWTSPTGTFPGTVRINPDQGSSYKCVDEDNFRVHNRQGFTGEAASATVEFEIPAAAITNQFRVRFMQASGVSSQTTNASTSRGQTAAGWRIDDVRFVLK